MQVYRNSPNFLMLTYHGDSYRLASRNEHSKSWWWHCERQWVSLVLSHCRSPNSATPLLGRQRLQWENHVSWNHPLFTVRLECGVVPCVPVEKRHAMLTHLLHPGLSKLVPWRFKWSIILFITAQGAYGAVHLTMKLWWISSLGYITSTQDGNSLKALSHGCEVGSLTLAIFWWNRWDFITMAVMI